MNTVIVVLLASTIIVTLAVGRWASKQNRGFVADHVGLFAFGVLFYWATPVLAGIALPAADATLPTLWLDQFRQVEPVTLAQFLALGIIFLLAWCAGAIVRRRTMRTDAAVTGLTFAPELVRLLFLPCLALTAWAMWRVRGDFFADYGLFYELQHQQRGMLLAVGVVVLALLLIQQSQAGGRTGSAFLRNRWAALYAAIAVAGLALGGRMYFVSGAVTLVTFWTVFNRPLRPSRVLFGLLVGAGIAGSIGAWRIGAGRAELSATAALFNVALEPVLVGHSLFTFLSLDRIELFNAPILLGSQLLNLIPTALLPNKLAYILDPAAMGYGAASPFGAFSSFASWIINFGALGTPFVLFALSFGLEHMRLRATPLAACCYAVICGFIPFSLFRDPFYTSVVKSILQLAVLVPLIVIAYLHVLTTIATARPAHAVFAAAPDDAVSP